jgi:membrane fusion protein (multidrug efflux system)
MHRWRNPIQPCRAIAKISSPLATALIVVAAVWGIWYFLTQAGRVHTDNAYVGADSAVVTPLVSGAVKEVRVGNTQQLPRAMCCS